MNFFKKIGLSFSCLLFLVLAGCSNDAKNINSLPVEYMSASFAINVNNLNELIGDADHVFVARIDKVINTYYERDKYPNTNYSITVVDNIKGNLKKNAEITIRKNGGVNKNGKSIKLFQGDSLPEVNKYYIVSAYTQPDGSLLISGPNSNVLCDGNSIEEIKKSEIYKKYSDAFKNEIKQEGDRQRFTSTFAE